MVPRYPCFAPERQAAWCHHHGDAAPAPVDLAGLLLESGEFDELSLPAIATDDVQISLTRGRVYDRTVGEALHAARHSAVDLLREKRNIGSALFAAQYQQQPIPAEGNMVHAEWLQTYNDLPEAGQIMQSWDMASKDGVLDDWSVCITARRVKNRVFVVDVWRRKVEFPDLRKAAIRLARDHKASVMLIEDQASGTQLYQALLNESPRGVPTPIPSKPEADKKTRLAGVTAMIEAGQLLLPREAGWLAELKQELLACPSGRYDDQVDALSQLLIWVGRLQRLDDQQPLVGAPILFVDGEEWPGTTNCADDYLDPF